jgi:hypothetical protein
MSRAAHPRLRGLFENSRAMSTRDEISAVLDAPAADLPLAELERILTDGYAEALTIEAETVRLEKQLSTAARQLVDGDAEQARQVSSLARLLDGRNGDLASLRRLLAELRHRTDELRARTSAR